MEQIRVIILRPTSADECGECTLTEELIDNTAEALDEILGECFDIGTPFPSIAPRLRAVVGDTSAFTDPYMFDGECQSWFGTMIFCHDDAPELASLTSEELELLKRILPRLVSIREA